MMLIWMVDADLPRPLMNQPVFDLDGRHVATPDLLDVEAGLACEYNGSLHMNGNRGALQEQLITEALYKRRLEDIENIVKAIRGGR